MPKTANTLAIVGALLAAGAALPALAWHDSGGNPAVINQACFQGDREACSVIVRACREGNAQACPVALSIARADCARGDPQACQFANILARPGPGPGNPQGQRANPCSLSTDPQGQDGSVMGGGPGIGRALVFSFQALRHAYQAYRAYEQLRGAAELARDLMQIHRNPQGNSLVIDAGVCNLLLQRYRETGRTVSDLQRDLQQLESLR